MEGSLDLVRRSRILATIVLSGTIALLVLLVAVPLLVPHESLPTPLLVFWGIFILIVALILGIAGAYVLLTRVRGGESLRSSADLQIATKSDPDAVGSSRLPGLEDLAIRLLDGDERRLMRVIVQARGDILQRDLVRLTSFSDAKVSRLLDRLEERGLVVRERHGMTNRVRLTLHEP